MKNLLILGASGSIGKQTIDVCDMHSDLLCIKGVGVGDNVDYLSYLLSKYELEYVYSKNKVDELILKYPNTRFYFGNDGLLEIIKENSYDTLVNALVGGVGLLPTIEGIKNHKDIALANKESLVMAGDIVNRMLKEYGTKLYPIDSEHSAIYQCLNGSNYKDINKLIITGSGGSFRSLKRDELYNVTVEDALKHPTWSMGAKITIDSATMMNKGFEIMEAHYLFNVDYDNIDVLLHSESIVHSLVEYKDGSILAQLSKPDMRIPIQYALLSPSHDFSPYDQKLDLGMLGSINFKVMDYDRYPLVKLIKEKAKMNGNFGAIINGANDAAVKLFLNKEIKFLDIEKSIFKALEDGTFIENPTLEEILASCNWSYNYVIKLWKK